MVQYGYTMNLEEIPVLGRKNKKKMAALFGGNIEPDCAYCQNSLTVQGQVRCRIGQIPENGACKRYAYDPLRRRPKGEPKLGNFSAEDFEL